MNVRGTSRRERTHPRQVVHPRLKRGTYERFKAYTAATGASDSAVIDAAVGQYIDKSSDTALILRRLDRLSRGLARSHRQNDALAELLGAFIQIWFGHTPPIPVEQQRAAGQSANKRYADLMDFIRRRIAGSKQVLVDLLGAEEADELGPKSATPAKGTDGGLDGE